MKIKYLPTEITVNEFFEVIDGQHRIEACKRLGLEVYYKVEPGLRLKDCQRYNTAGKIWNKTTFHGSYCDLGLKPYMQLQEFRNTYPEFSLTVAEAIMTNNVAGVNNRKRLTKTVDKREGERVHIFQDGLFTINDIKSGYDTAAKISEFKPYFKYYNDGTFVRVMIPIFKKTVYSHERMLEKLSKQPTAMTKCMNVQQYILMLEKIYNYKCRENDKVSLQYGK